MIAALLGLLAAGLAVAAGAPWWTLFLAAPFFVPGRIGPAVGAVAVLAMLPWAPGPAWRDFVLLACGVLVAWAVLYRIGRAVAWVAVPWWALGLAALEVAWRVAPPAGYWTDSDVAARARILALAAAACLGMAAHYLPRYRKDEPGPAGPAFSPGAAGAGGSGTAGGRDETR